MSPPAGKPWVGWFCPRQGLHRRWQAVVEADTAARCWIALEEADLPRSDLQVLPRGRHPLDKPPVQAPAPRAPG